jgi:enamine deaminase RidA (YjgF/YER057c/UK114 family)
LVSIGRQASIIAWKVPAERLPHSLRKPCPWFGCISQEAERELGHDPSLEISHEIGLRHGRVGLERMPMAETPRMSAEARLQELDLQLPPPPKPVGVYNPLVIVDRLAYASGHGPLQPDGSLIVGRVGQDLDAAAGKAAARQTGLAILATLRAVLGSLDRIERVVKVFGMVNCTVDFKDHPQVINGCSELFAELWGPDKGVGARSAVGMASLPSNIAVEIEAVFEIR